MVRPLQRQNALNDLPVRWQQLLRQYTGPSHSQLQQDVLAWTVNDQCQNGYFVEIGACDGVHLSNTLLLERRHGWTGILAEPARGWHNRLASNRSAIIDHRAVYARTGETLQFLETTQPDLSGLCCTLPTDGHQNHRHTDQEYPVTTVSLQDLLREHQAPAQIHYLSMDVEGAEWEILRHFDFSKHSINVITVEHNYVASTRSCIQKLMEQNNYVRLLDNISRWDDWYVLNTTMEQV